MRTSLPRVAALLAVLAGLLAALAASASPSGAADRVYWGNGGQAGGADGISFAALDGAGGGDLTIAGAALDTPIGVAIDSAAGRIYWSNTGPGGGSQGISFAALDGSGGGDLNTAGATLANPNGVAIDPVAGRVYWANASASVISFANLNGSGGGDLTTAGATVDNPIGVVVDPAAGRIYWTNSGLAGGPQRISFAALDGSGGGDINTAGATVANPFGVAVHSGRVYWPNADFAVGPGGISFAALDSSGGADLSTAGATMATPVGPAIDPEVGRIYWGNPGSTGGPQGISFAALDGSGGGDVNTSGATLDSPAFPALLKAPAGTGSPEASGGAGHRSRLSCSGSTWAPDLLAARFYRAPQSFGYRWSRYGKRMQAADATSYKPHAVGTYRCAAVAENHAGQSTQTSEPHVNFRFGQLTQNRGRGTAKLVVKLPSRGKVIGSGKKVKRQARGTQLASKKKHLHKASLQITAKGAAKRKLQESGAASVRLKVAFRSKGGEKGTLTRSVTLTLRGL